MSGGRRLSALLALLACAGCTAEGESVVSAPGTPNMPPSAPPPALPSARPVASPPAGAPSAAPGDIVLGGEPTQGGFLRGRAPAGASALALDGEALAMAEDGSFFIAFDRDAPASARLEIALPGGQRLVRDIAIAPRAWRIERVDVARTPGGPSAAFMALRRPELERIAAARARGSDSQGWRQPFIWPVKGRLSGLFGAQRIYRGGEPGSYHSGLDIATGGSGTPYVAPADGTVVLAADSPFSLEGNLLIIDHGNGLSSAFLHSQRLYVKEGERVRQGQHIGDIGMTGRASGPHLHWGMVWRGRRLDPLLFTGPMA